MTIEFWLAIAVWFMVMSAVLIVLWATCILSGQIERKEREDDNER
jgi:uncharacterized membrane protein